MTEQDLRRDAVERAYRDHADDVYRVAFAILRDRDAAVDATHDCFARAFERWEQYDVHRPLRAWLHGIVSNAALDDLRRRRVRRLAVPAVAQLRTASTTAPEDGDPATGVATRGLVEEALGLLKPDARAALILRHYYGYDYAEIAGFLRTSPGNVGSILSRAHAALRDRLAADPATTDRAGGVAAGRTMTRGVPMDPDRSPRPGNPVPDDDTLAALVRDVADDWRMPPRGLDDVTWRERSGRSRGSSGGVRWTRRLAGAATLAVVATIVLSFAAIWMTAPRPSPGLIGASPGATGTAAPTASGGPAVTPIPQLVRDGGLPSVTSVMVWSNGRYRVADLATGTLGAEAMGLTAGESAVLARPDGGWVCLCTDLLRSSSTGNELTVTLDAVDASGVSTLRRPYQTITGTADPTAPARLQPQLVDARLSGSADGRYGFVGWSRRDGATGWTVGVDVIDLASLDAVATSELTLAEPVVVDGHARVRTAPTVALAPNGDALLLSSLWYEDIANTSSVSFGTDHWIATFDGRALGEPAAAGGTTGDVCGEIDAGLVSERTADGPAYYTVCSSPEGAVFVKRIDAGGRLIDATDALGSSGSDGGAVASRHGDAVFIWSPFRRLLTRFDLTTAEVVGSAVRTGAAPDGLAGTLAAAGQRLGRWIAPAVVAKLLLEPGLVVSADGTRVYALGVGAPGQDEFIGSTRRLRLRRGDPGTTRPVARAGRPELDRGQRGRAIRLRGRRRRL